ncbi:hypothetical protein [Petralouisia muris]|nr:hypothetical protein [Petralouisia muris]
MKWNNGIIPEFHFPTSVIAVLWGTEVFKLAAGYSDFTEVRTIS